MPGVTITSPLPAVGSTAGPTWATQLIAWCNEIEADIEASVVPAEISVNANFEFNNYRVTELQGAQFQSKATPSTAGGTDTNMLEVVSGELFFIDGGGASIQMTSGGALNSSTTGGIVGDYSDSLANVSYSVANTEYTFNDHNAATRPAGLNCGNIALREKGASSNYVSLQSPGSLAASYVWVFPTALPGSGTEVVTINNSGIVDTTSALSVTTITTTGVGTFTAGVKFKASGVGSDTASYFQDQGSTTLARAFDPVVAFDSLTSTITYTTRYAYYQKVQNWVHAFVSVIFECSAGGSATRVRVTGLPHKAKGDLDGTTTGNIVACGQCANFPPSGSTLRQGYIGSTATPADTHNLVYFNANVIPVMVDDDATVYFLDDNRAPDNVAATNNEYDGSATPPTSSGTPLNSSAAGALLNSSGTFYITFSISYRSV